MRIVYSCLLFVILAPPALSQILNGDFEAWTNRKPDQWLTFDTTGTYEQGIDSLNGSSCFTYHASHSGSGTFLTWLLSNRTLLHPYGSRIPVGNRTLTVHYSNTCPATNGYVMLSYLLRDQSGTVYYSGSVALFPGTWQSAHVMLPESKTPVDSDFVDLELKYAFATTNKVSPFSYSVSIDDVSLDSTTDASAPSANQLVEADIQLYPNPGLTEITIALPNQNINGYEFALFDLRGICVLANTAFRLKNENSVTFDASNTPNGIYFLRIRSDNRISILRVIIRR